MINYTYQKQRSIIESANCLKFCYFLMILLFFSCGNSPKSSEESQESEKVESSSESNGTVKTILCFGDSITAGYGLDDINEAYPAVLQSKIDSLNWNYEVINSGLSGETTAGGLSRINWILNQKINVFLLELGANDGLRGIPLSETRSNLNAIIEAVRSKDPNIPIILAGMELPPNMGEDYISEFRTIYSDLAKEYQLPFIPFILDGVGGIKELNQNDGIHPTAQGHQIVANNVWNVLKPLIAP